MRFQTLTGKEKYLNVENRRIKWNGPSRSKFQKRIKDFLYPYWKQHVVYEELPVAGTKLSLDFYNANKKIAIECQGKQHNKYNKFFHQKNPLNYFKQIKRDSLKFFWCEKNEIKLIEIEPQDSLEEIFETLGLSL